MSVTTDEALNFVVEDEFSGERLDKVLARLMQIGRAHV